jgi:hypothetical protein
MVSWGSFSFLILLSSLETRVIDSVGIVGFISILDGLIDGISFYSGL